MDLTTILELLGSEHVAGDEMTAAFLEDAVAAFGANPAVSTSAIRQLQSTDPSGFVLAAVRLLITSQEKSPGVQYIASLMFAGNVLIDPLLNARILHLDAAISLARNLATVEPLLDVRLMRKILADAGGDVQAVKPDVALRVLSLVEAISDCSRLSSYLMLLMRHYDQEVCSEAALLLNTATFSLNRAKSLLTSDSPSLRATTIESLWNRRDPEILALLQEASKDADLRVRVTALIGLARSGDAESARRLKDLARTSGPLLQAVAAWAAGELPDAAYAAELLKLAGDETPEMRALALRRIQKLRLKPSRPQPPSNGVH